MATEMQSSTFKALAAAALLLLTASASHAVDTVSGSIDFHNDVRAFDFTLATAGTVNILSNSWQYGVNFDPTAALWRLSTTGYTLVAANDDDELSEYDPLGNFNFRLQLDLAAGSYRLTLMASPNAAVGHLLSQGFTADGQAPMALANWTQPGSDPNFPNQKGGYYSVVFEGTQGVAAVPEPAAWLLMGLGLAGLLARRRAVVV